MKKKVIAIIMALVLMVVTLSGCSTEADKVNQNISQQAGNFNVTRRLAVTNLRTDTPLFELIGNFDISNNTHDELVVTAEVSKGHYKKHYIHLNEWTFYVVEDVSGAYVDPYHYEVNFLPQMFGVTIISED